MTIFDQIKIEISKPQKNYAEAKLHAQKLDLILGFNCYPIEDKLLRDQKAASEKTRNLWIGLDLQSLQTPYSEIVQMIDFLKPEPGALWLDLGAGYGRMGIVIGFLHPEVIFKGYEFVQERVDEGTRILKNWDLNNSSLLQKDIVDSKFEIDRADLYFIYDFSSRSDIYTVLEKLRQIAATKPIRVIARGRGIKNWILMDFPWLCEVVAPVHFETWSLFQS